jgi:hypothetical protein
VRILLRQGHRQPIREQCPHTFQATSRAISRWQS